MTASGEASVVPHPIGIRPRHIWLEHRISDLYAAIERYAQACVALRVEWIDEIKLIEQELAERNSK